MENQSNIKLIRILLSIIAAIILFIVLKEMAFVIIPLSMSIFLAALLVPPFMQLKKWKVNYNELIFGKPSYDLFIDDKCIFFKKNWYNYIIKKL